MMHIKKFSELCGVSVRTLHYYDEIGLLKPCIVDEQNGYRFYNDDSLCRMQEILFYRELDFSLKDIAEILASENYDKQKALKEQKHLLELKKKRLERLIDAIDKLKEGEITMNVFDNNEYEVARQQYENEAKERWGETNAYKEFETKTANYTKDKWQTAADGLNAVMKKFADCKESGYAEDSEKAQALVKELQAYINDNYYTCTNEVLMGLGQMYVGDERFTENIDKNGDGTAEFISRAIEIYCK